ncbi:MAG: LamG domain-containing protein [Planctomycetes bacterium]|nr:LamG domain-containing protein [Planctomycetota bacterium]
MLPPMVPRILPVLFQSCCVGSLLLLFACASSSGDRTESVEHGSPRRFAVWATSCAHLSVDLRMGRESLARPIRQSEGQIDGSPAFDWDIMLNAGDICGTNRVPREKEGLEYLRQTQALRHHLREQIYSVSGNHDASHFDPESETNWFEEWIDPLGEHRETSLIDASRRPFPVFGEWDHYGFVAGNILFLMLSDRNDLPHPVGKGEADDGGYGGYPAGALTRESFEWWKSQVLANQDKIIITVHHHVLRDTTTASGVDEGSRYHHSKLDRAHASYLYYLVETRSPKLEFSSATDAFATFFREFQEANGRPAIDMWVGGHTHVVGPDDRTGNKSITEQRWGVTFLQVAALTKYHGGTTPLSRLIEFQDGSAEADAKVYLHESYRAHRRGFFEPAERTIPLRHPVQAPAPYVPTGAFPCEDQKIERQFSRYRGKRSPSPVYDTTPDHAILGEDWDPEVGGPLGVLGVIDDAVDARDPDWPAIEAENGLRFMRFAGAQKVRVGPVDWNSFHDGVTVAAWIRVSNSDYGYSRRIISGHRRTQSGGFNLNFDLKRNGLRWRVWNESRHAWSDLFHETPVEFDAWQSVAAVADERVGEIRLYLNGERVASKPWKGGKISNPDDVSITIGATSGEWRFSQTWDGDIREPAVYPRPLSDVEVRRLFDGASR